MLFSGGRGTIHSPALFFQRNDDSANTQESRGNFKILSVYVHADICDSNDRKGDNEVTLGERPRVCDLT